MGTVSGAQDVGHLGVVTGRDGFSLRSIVTIRIFGLALFPQDKEGFDSDASHAENRPLFSRSRHPTLQSLDELSTVNKQLDFISINLYFELIISGIKFIHVISIVTKLKTSNNHLLSSNLINGCYINGYS